MRWTRARSLPLEVGRPLQSEVEKDYQRFVSWRYSLRAMIVLGTDDERPVPTPQHWRQMSEKVDHDDGTNRHARWSCAVNLQLHVSIVKLFASTCIPPHDTYCVRTAKLL
jgi:hypothetical protein